MPCDTMIHMTIITIPQKLLKEKELVLMPRSTYEEFLRLQEMLKNRIAEEKDIDTAVAEYGKEKGGGKLKIIKSLAELD